MRRLMRLVVRWYLGLPFRPLKGLVAKVYDVYRSVNRNRTVIATIDGITYELDLNEMIDSAIYYAGCYEPQTTRAIERLCKPGMTVLDVGANVGCHTLRFAKLTGPQGKVIAFEPMSWAFAKLQRNVQLNDFDNIILERIALSNQNEDNQVVNLRCSWPLSGFDDTQLHPIDGGYIMEDMTSFITLDDYVKKQAVGKIDLVKLDVDGHELKVIQGAVETLRLHKPIIIMELGVFTLEEAGDHVTELVSLLLDLGYRFYSERTMTTFPSTDAMINSIPNKGVINVILSAGDLSAATSV